MVDDYVTDGITSESIVTESDILCASTETHVTDNNIMSINKE